MNLRASCPGAVLDVTDPSDVKLGSAWWRQIAHPHICRETARGHGLPVYPPSAAKRSLDYLLRTMLTGYAFGGHAFEEYPWFDEYVHTHPMPLTGSLSTAGWLQEWHVMECLWGKTKPALLSFIRDMRKAVFDVYAVSVGVDTRCGTDGHLAKLGYATADEETFDADYFTVKAFMSDNRFRVDYVRSEAILDALQIHAHLGAWQVLVETARTVSL